MNDYIKIALAGVAGAIIALLAVHYLAPVSYGANRATTTITNPFNFQQGLTSTSGSFSTTLAVTGVATFTAQSVMNGGVLHSYPLSTSTPASLTLAASDITNYESIVQLPSAGSAITDTLPASSSLSAFVPTAGDWAEQCITNGTTTAAINITIAGGTGTHLLTATTTPGGGAVTAIGPGNTGCIKYFRVGAGNNARDINALLTIFQ